jgi:hypothetical protein
MSDFSKYIGAIGRGHGTIDAKHGATARLSKLLPDNRLADCLWVYGRIREYDRGFRNGQDESISDALADIEGGIDILISKKKLYPNQKRLLIHTIVMSMTNVTPDKRVQYIVSLWSKRPDKRRDIALDVLLESIIEGLDERGQKHSWKLVSDFLVEQGLYDTEALDAGEPLRLRYLRIKKSGHGKAVLDAVLHAQVGTGEASSTAI